MKQLESLHIIQFSFFDAETFNMRGNACLLAANGSGKTSVLDAIQIAILGGNLQYTSFNSQLSSSKAKRTLKDYCLGAVGSSNETNAQGKTKRDHANSYITLVFKDKKNNKPISVGICIEASIKEPKHKVKGLYVINGVEMEQQSHLQQTDDGFFPLEWKSFENELKRRAKNTPNSSLSLPRGPEEYVNELLYALQPNAKGINKNAFVKAFKESMTLSNVEDVNIFVRNYLVDSTAINKQSALAQVNRFKELKILIKTTEDKIEELSLIENNSKKLETSLKRRDTIEYVKSLINFERKEERIGSLNDEVEELSHNLVTLKNEIEEKENSRNRSNQAIKDLTNKINLDSSSHNFNQTKELLDTFNSELTKTNDDIDTFNFNLRKLMSKMGQCFHECNDEEYKKLDELMTVLEASIEKDNAINHKTFDNTINYIESIKPHFDELLSTLKQEANGIQNDIDAKEGQLKAFKKGAIKLSEHVGSAITEFDRAGISATPVCALVKVKDSAWQGSIESFLRSNKEALVVEAGKETEAIQTIRNHHAQWSYSITIVQPQHATSQENNGNAHYTSNLLVEKEESVAASTALNFVKQIFGKMECVETEYELMERKRAITKDGMLSANGGTKRLRIKASEHWQIGTEFNLDVYQSLSNEVKELSESLKNKNLKLQLFNDAKTLLDREIDRSSYRSLIEAKSNYSKKIDSTSTLETIEEPDFVKRLREQIAVEELEVENTDKLIDQLKEEKASKTNKINNNNQQITELNQALSKIHHKMDELKENEFYDPSTSTDLYELITNRDEENIEDYCEEIHKDEIKKTGNLSNNVKAEFKEYIDKYGVTLIEERSNLVKLRQWTIEELDKLKTSTLIEYKDQAENALDAAETSFRSDIAYRIRDAMKDLESGIRRLNKQLGICPTFSSNERYKFKANPSERYKKIYDYIKHIDEFSSESLFNKDDNIKEEIIELLEMSSSDDNRKTQNPLEDYRLFYNFDLSILHDGREVGTLSNRIGRASNGEHRVPFYVIAGAALASAYRIDGDKNGDGAGLMLLDEAFHGIDQQNSYAVSKFLQDLGLQLIMAGPESDQGKLAPMTQSMFYMYKFGEHNVFVETQHFVDKVETIMTSDMPDLHPDLIDSLEQEMIDKQK